jgi:hypothetical protein
MGEIVEYSGGFSAESFVREAFDGDAGAQRSLWQ